ncbi:uncharacterized protein B0J16DRAFT_138184 [Fusarium flagelliforme]|uniref:uncharacterized protein n=1 Tax=Fusarium flagelliforme TaxID=2675880 RepID=UPI001E8EEB96|nr:uncharacterized protein B0J16DRAFT_138184 [Fusarium flagelliforme]KAH7185649.1 hypothetical protein B0J16DRAFT_138184 [Fusarium flagelliforme]
MTTKTTLFFLLFFLFFQKRITPARSPGKAPITRGRANGLWTICLFYSFLCELTSAQRTGADVSQKQIESKGGWSLTCEQRSGGTQTEELQVLMKEHSLSESGKTKRAK